jgi:DnaJ family protein A protein 5
MREDTRKEYNNTVRELATFIQNRDPRYHAYQRERDRAKKEAARNGPGKKSVTGSHSRSAQDRSGYAAHAAMSSQAKPAVQDFEEQLWQHVERMDQLDDDDFAVSAKPRKPSNWYTAEQEEQDESDEGEDEYECVACDKVFASEQSWLNHERSKKHKQAIDK